MSGSSGSPKKGCVRQKGQAKRVHADAGGSGIESNIEVVIASGGYTCAARHVTTGQTPDDAMLVLRLATTSTHLKRIRLAWPAQF